MPIEPVNAPNWLTFDPTPPSRPHLPPQGRKAPSETQPRSADDSAPRPTGTPAPQSEVGSRPVVEIVPLEGDTAPGSAVVRVIDPDTGAPMMQLPPDGVLTLVEMALWRLRRSGATGHDE